MALIKRKPLFGFTNGEYTIINLKNENKFTDRQLFKEYQRLRSIANKRLKRIGESEFASDEFYTRWKDTFKKAPSELKRRDLVYKLYDAFIFLTTPHSTVKGMRERKNSIIGELMSLGVKVQDAEAHYIEFVDFMVYAKSVLQGYMYSSEDLAELWEDNIDGVRTMSWEELESYLTSWAVKEDAARKRNIARAEQWAKFSSDNLGVFGW